MHHEIRLQMIIFPQNLHTFKFKISFITSRGSARLGVRVAGDSFAASKFLLPHFRLPQFIPLFQFPSGESLFALSAGPPAVRALRQWLARKFM